MQPSTETYVASDKHTTQLGPTWMLLATPDEMPDALRCAYASKRCDNPRTIKKSGGLHRFCAFHRERANRNQWRFDHRRRMQKKHKIGCTHPTTPSRSPSQTRPSSRGSPRCLAECEASQAEAAAVARQESRRCERELDALSTPMDDYEVWNSREEMLNAQDVAILAELLFEDGASPITHRATGRGEWPSWATDATGGSSPVAFAMSNSARVDQTMQPTLAPRCRVSV